MRPKVSKRQLDPKDIPKLPNSKNYCLSVIARGKGITNILRNNGHNNQAPLLLKRFNWLILWLVWTEERTEDSVDGMRPIWKNRSINLRQLFLPRKRRQESAVSCCSQNQGTLRHLWTHQTLLHVLVLGKVIVIGFCCYTSLGKMNFRVRRIEEVWPDHSHEKLPELF